METARAALTAAVRELYEAHPYPRYPLLARPRWQDGYLAHSGFARRLAADLLGTWAKPAASGGAPETTVLIGGGGEILPYVIRKWEPTGHRVVSVDLSASSSRRARWRLAASWKSAQFLSGDLDDYLAAASAGTFTHIDAYGVLHHMPNPAETLVRMHRSLAPGGTARVMLYNAVARDWIFQLQRFCALLGFEARSGDDVRQARSLLALAGRHLPALGQRLSQLGAATLTNDARFADTFLHPREARLDTSAWLARIADAGFSVVGLFDRYGELDELSNPLWQAPSAEALAERALDRRFENNLELFLVRSGGDKRAAALKSGRALTWIHRLKAPPQLWFNYDETRTLAASLKLRLWYAHIGWVTGGDRGTGEALLRSLPIRAAQRLARVGAILPGQIADLGLRAVLASPMTDRMEPPELPVAVDLVSPEIEAAVDAALAAHNRSGVKRRKLALARLLRAQGESRFAR